MLEKPLCISYPKSGRTWLRMMLRSLGVNLEYSHLDTGADRKSWGKGYLEIKVPKAPDGKIVFLHRDPRDTVVSMFYEIIKRQLPIRKLEEYKKYESKGLIPPMGLSEFVRSPRFGIEKTIVFNMLCKEHLNAHLLTYEKITSNPLESLIEVLNYLDVQRSLDQIQKAINENDFESMHKREVTGDIPIDMIGRLGPTDSSDLNSYKVRKGIVGGWLEEMDEETQIYANELIRKYNYEDYMKSKTSKVSVLLEGTSE
jgi:hypothetical protein